MLLRETDYYYYYYSSIQTACPRPSQKYVAHRPLIAALWDYINTCYSQEHMACYIKSYNWVATIPGISRVFIAIAGTDGYGCTETTDLPPPPQPGHAHH